MQLNIENKLALVTGSTGGIGGAIACTLGAEGVRVIVHGRNAASAEQVVSRIHERGGSAYMVLGDLSTDTGASELINTIRQKFGELDILINNAGAFEVCSWWEGSPERWAQVYNATVLSMVRMIQGFVPGMRQKGWGRVVQVSSIAATLAPPLFPDYAAAKAACLNMTLSLAKDLAGTGVTVNTVSPGPVVTATWEKFARQIGARNNWPEDIEQIKAKLLNGFLANPSGRLGSPHDIAHAVSFLVAQQADYINGLNLKVGGGLDASLA